MTSFKCRKCRDLLFHDNVVIDAHRGLPDWNKTETDCDSCATVTNLWFLNEEFLPLWVEHSVNEACWLKGKLLCPKCKGRLGSFDFVSGSRCDCGCNLLPPVHIMKCRVDCELAVGSDVVARIASQEKRLSDAVNTRPFDTQGCESTHPENFHD